METQNNSLTIYFKDNNGFPQKEVWELTGERKNYYSWGSDIQVVIATGRVLQMIKEAWKNIPYVQNSTEMRFYGDWANLIVNNYEAVIDYHYPNRK